MELIRNCPACKNEFKPTVDWQECCTERCAHTLRNRRYRAKRRKGGGGGGGGNNGGGGGGAPTLFDTITPVDSRAIYAPDTCYRTPDQEPARKPVVSVIEKSSKAAA